MATSNTKSDMELECEKVTKTEASADTVERISFPRRQDAKLPIAFAASRNERQSITNTTAGGHKRQHVLISPSDSSLSPFSQMLVGNNRSKVAKKACAKLLWHEEGREVDTNSAADTVSSTYTAKTPVARSKFPRRRVTGPSSAVARARDVGRSQHGLHGEDAGGGNNIRNMLMSPTDNKLSPTSQMLLGNSRIAIGPKDRAQLLWGDNVNDKDTHMSPSLPSSNENNSTVNLSARTTGPVSMTSAAKKRRVVMSPTDNIISPISRLLVGGNTDGERTKAAKKASTKLMWNVITSNIPKEHPTALSDTQNTDASDHFASTDVQVQINATKTPVSRTSLPRRRLTGPASAIKRMRQDFMRSPTDATLSPMSRLLVGNKGVKVGKKETAQLLWNQHAVDTAFSGNPVVSDTPRVVSRGAASINVNTTTTPHANSRVGFPSRRPRRLTGPASLTKRVSKLGLTKSPSDAQVSPMTRILVGCDHIKAAVKTRAKLLWGEEETSSLSQTAPLLPAATDSSLAAVVAMDQDSDASKPAPKVVKKKKKMKKKTTGNVRGVTNKKQPTVVANRRAGVAALPFVVVDEENTNNSNETGTSMAEFKPKKIIKKANKVKKHVVVVSGGTAGFRVGGKSKMKLGAGDVDKAPVKRVSKGPLTARHINVL